MHNGVLRCLSGAEIGGRIDEREDKNVLQAKAQLPSCRMNKTT